MLRHLCSRSCALIIPLIVFPVTVAAQQRDRAVREWLVAGTFPVDTGATRVTRDYIGGEAQIVAQEGARWSRVSADSLGRVNLNNAFTTQRDNAAAYGFIYITSPADRTIHLGIETDDDGMAWLNGALFYHKEVARGLGETDTVTVRLARGVNRLLYKVVNRSGGFGLGGRLLASSRDRIDDLVLSVVKPAEPLAIAPAPYVTHGSPRLDPNLSLQPDGHLMTVSRVDITRWGAVREPLKLNLTGEEITIPAAKESLPVTVAMPLEFGELSNALLKQRATAVRAGDLLELLSMPITLSFEWTDHEHGSYATKIPRQLAGLTLAIDFADFAPGSTITINGIPAKLDSFEQAVACEPCKEGDLLRIEVTTNGKQWWDPPRLLVRDTGWRDAVEGVRYARILTGDTTLVLPSDQAAHDLLATLEQPDKAAYYKMLDALRGSNHALEAQIRRDTIDLVGNSHIDAAWLWRWPETVDVVRNTWRTAVKLLDKYPEMKFAASGAQYYVWLEQYEPELLAKIQQLVKEGRWILVGGMWVESDVNMPTGEALARQELYGQRTYMRLFGRYATVAWIPDTFGYPWQLPQIFTQAGLNQFITQKLRWNDTNKWTADRNYFIWQGRDGTALPTYIPFGYDHDLSAPRLAREFRAQADSAATRRLLTLYGVGDHGGGPTMQMLDRRRLTDRVPAFPITRDADPAQSLAAMAREAPHPPVIDDELYFEYHRGVQTTQAANKQWNRRMEALLLATDAAGAVSGAGDRKALELAWQKTLFNQFHDILPGSSIGPVYDDAKVDYHAADSLAQRELRVALDALSARLDTRGPAGATPVFVFNPAGYDRGGTIRLPNTWRAPRVTEGAGRILASAVRNDSLTIVVRDVPAVGGSVVFVAEAPAAAGDPQHDGTVLENDFLRVEIDPATGNIAKLFDKRLKRDVIKPGALANALMLMPDNPADWDAWNIDSTNGPWSPVADSVRIGRIAEDAVGVSLTVERAAPGVHATQRYELPRSSAQLIVDNTIEWRTAHQLLKAFFPLAVQADSVWAEIAYGAIGRPAVPMTRKDSARFELPMHRWVDASNGEWGVSIVNDAKYGYDVRGDTLRLSLLRAPKWPDPNADMGVHRFRYSIVPHRGGWSSGATRNAADELNRPLRALPVTQHKGSGRSFSVLRVEGNGVELSGLKQAEDADTWIVRIVETAGATSTAVIHARGVTQWREVDFIERPRGEWRNADGRIELPMRPWQVRSVELRNASARGRADRIPGPRAVQR